MLFERSCHQLISSLNPLMVQMNEYSVLNDRIKHITQTVHNLKSRMEGMKRQCEKSAISKSRVHADIHRFQFAKTAAEMRQKYCMQIEELQSQLSMFSEKCNKMQECYSELEQSFVAQKEEKELAESQ